MVLMCSNEKLDNLSFEKPSTKAMKADVVAQIDGVLVVRLANGRFLTSARDFHKWAYTIGHDTVFREPVVRGLAAIGFITQQEAAEHMAEHRRAKERRDEAWSIEQLTTHAAKLGISDVVAQAIEARSGETGTGSTVGESAVRQDAPDA